MAKGRFKERIANAVLNSFAPVLKPIIKSYFKLGLDKFKEASPEAHKTTLASLYPSVDVHLEQLTEKTETDIDDIIIDAIKESIEDSAKEVGVTLPNLDND